MPSTKKSKFKLKLMTAAIAISLISLNNQAIASVNPQSAVSECGQKQDLARDQLNQVGQQLWMQDPMLQAVAKKADPTAWSGSPFGSCLDILPSGISLTLTFPTMEEIMEMIMKQVAKMLCDKLRGAVAGAMGQFNNLASGANISAPPSFGGFQLPRMGTSVNTSNGGYNSPSYSTGNNYSVGVNSSGMFAKSGSLPTQQNQQTQQTQPQNQKTQQPQLAPVIVSGQPQTQQRVQPQQNQTPQQQTSQTSQQSEGFFSSTASKVKCWFGGACN